MLCPDGLLHNAGVKGERHDLTLLSEGLIRGKLVKSSRYARSNELRDSPPYMHCGEDARQGALHVRYYWPLENIMTLL
jgi:hypothetical protein